VERNDTYGIKLIKADWDLVPKTKFLRIHGLAWVETFDDVLTAEVADSGGINEKVLLIHVSREQAADGLRKPQPAPFWLTVPTTGHEVWTEVQAAYEGEHDTMFIRKLIRA